MVTKIGKLNKDVIDLQALRMHQNDKIGSLEAELKAIQYQTNSNIVDKNFKCTVCLLRFTNKEDLKCHWLTTQVFCKTSQVCCEGSYTNGSDQINIKDIEHQDHIWEEPQTKCVESVFISETVCDLANHLIKDH